MDSNPISFQEDQKSDPSIPLQNKSTLKETNQNLQQIQNLQEQSLLIQILIILVSVVLSQLTHNHLVFNRKFKEIMVILWFCLLMLTQIMPNILSKGVLKYILLFFYSISKIFTLWFIGYFYLVESLLILCVLVYFQIYFFLKTSNRIRGMNNLSVHYYIPHIIIFSCFYSYIIIHEIPINLFYYILYCCFMILYSMFLLLNLQLIGQRNYLLENNDFCLSTIFIDSDLFIPSNFIQMHINLNKQNVVKDIKQQSSQSESIQDEDEDQFQNQQ